MLSDFWTLLFKVLAQEVALIQWFCLILILENQAEDRLAMARALAGVQTSVNYCVKHNFSLLMNWSKVQDRWLKLTKQFCWRLLVQGDCLEASSSSFATEKPNSAALHLWCNLSCNPEFQQRIHAVLFRMYSGWVSDQDISILLWQNSSKINYCYQLHFYPCGLIFENCPNFAVNNNIVKLTDGAVTLSE